MTTTTIGKIGTQSAVRRWTMDEFTFTYIVDGPMSLSPTRFLSSFPDSYWRDHPEALDEAGGVPMTAGGLLVERDDLRLLIDAGLGDIKFDSHYGPIQGGALLDTLKAVGLEPGDIEVFALTHIHIDHTGWAFVDDGHGARTATFPNASYVLARQEWEPLSQGIPPADMPDPTTVVEPLLNHPNLKLVEDGGEVVQGVSALVTPGHTPGHASYIMTSASGNRLVVFGDVFHSPAQLEHLDWGSAPDSHTESVQGARARVLSELLKDDTYAFSYHFGDQPFGKVVRGENGRVVWEPVPTEALF
ncbi:MBL fold metallo-hydrolase [Paenarthrobacter sp. A20]|uniref:MBL fold metallo-hydrolase n=1 Tax=Paenarthrobacter sp. A20 TaxID=2817891 RepID=UPI00209D933C|nr:MBL fold metallo-hydrolase [Paenarthrobacter sp. A20]MCP1415599.1 glyoxylase-like metal-dependent hydrolase (beta-lactamase superfamily II) [Paenarthrobacter sp. A20]